MVIRLFSPGQNIGKVASEGAVVEFDQAPSVAGFEQQVEVRLAEEKLFTAVFAPGEAEVMYTLDTGKIVQKEEKD